MGKESSKPKIITIKVCLSVVSPMGEVFSELTSTNT